MLIVGRRQSVQVVYPSPASAGLLPGIIKENRL
jgi:hypothetical protein